MSNKKVNLIILIICLCSTVAIGVILFIANNRPNVVDDDVVAVKNINALNSELSYRMQNLEKDINVTLRKYEIDGLNFQVEVSVRENSSLYVLNKFVIGSNIINLNLTDPFMSLEFGELQESSGDKLIYAYASAGSQDGYGIIRIFNKEGEILYSNNRVYLVGTNIKRITITEQYPSLLMSVCDDASGDDIVSKTITYDMENKKLKLINSSEKLVKDICFAAK